MRDTLNELLTYYYKARAKFLKEYGGEYFIRIPLTFEFLKECEQRIVEGHKKYSTDWITKDNIKEIEFEKKDIVNYLLLDACQKRFLDKCKNKSSTP